MSRLHCTSHEMSDSILMNKEILEKFLKSNIKRVDLIKILRVILQIYASGNDSLAEILKITISDEFRNNVLNYLSQVDSGRAASNRNIVIDDLTHITKYFDIIIHELPMKENYYLHFQYLLENVLKTASAVVKNKNRVDVESEAVLLDWNNELILLYKLKLLQVNEESEEYQSMSLFPNPVDFFQEKNLVPNKINSAYTNAEEYLDIQFKLYKEDYTSAVRQGIKQYKREICGAQCAANSAVRVFRCVRVHSVGVSDTMREGMYFLVQFTVEDAKRIREDEINNQKMFMNGQLVFFSFSHFTTFIIASVIDGNAPVLDDEGNEHRAIKVSIVGDSPPLIPKGKYTMIEPYVFFEPYYQVLRTFQFITPSQFPMKKYIVDLRFAHEKPSYLAKADSFLINNEYVALKDLCDWSPKNIQLNDSQLVAFKSALINEFALIQGPPGTGKTHLVSSIIETLIANKKYRRAPIFLVCSRNSSLDHVLEPLKKKGHSVLRLGGQTKSSLLKECMISNLKFPKINKRPLVTTLKLIKEDLKTKAELGEMCSSDLHRLDECQKKFINLCDEDDAKGILSNNVDIIGATTSGAAKAHYMMSLIKPEVVIIEEAAEVLEGHVVASIPQQSQHVILIGDHKQLQPTPADHMSSENYNMDISLFERLVDNGLKCHTLTVQHRMRPEISSLISPLIYENLTNHSSVCKYPDILGVSRNVFFLDHRNPEDKATELKSHWNIYEADTLLALADYLTKQGYKSSDITILAGYSAQVTCLTKGAKQYPNLKETRISAIDNYQGEENLIILLSLVRSGSNKIGFLKKYNRVNVALSRAKHGLYIVGNMALLSSQSQLWQSVRKILGKSKAIDFQLPLKCQTHGNITLVKHNHQITKLRLGGCSSLCHEKLSCGHPCRLPCHPATTEHKPCDQPCTRMKNVNHKLPGTLGLNQSNPRTVLRVLHCGHQATLEWNESINHVKCLEFCARTCERGHICKALCYQPCPPCDVLLEMTCCLLPYTVECHMLD